MATDYENRMPLRSYLLGDLNPDEQEDLERRLMIESDAFEELQRVEEELIDEYLDGDITGTEKDRFENFFLAAPQRQQKLRFARSLKRYIAARRPVKNRRAFWSKIGQSILPVSSPVLKWALAASFLLLIGGGTWATVKISGIQSALDRSQAEAGESQRLLEDIRGSNLELRSSLEQESARSSRLEQEIAGLKESQKTAPSLLSGQIPSTLFAVILDPRRSRSSGGMREINIPSGKDFVEFDLKMEILSYPRYRVELERIGGDVVSTQTESSIEGRFPGLAVAAELLTSGDYVLTLSGITDTGGIEEIEDYYFRVKKQ